MEWTEEESSCAVVCWQLNGQNELQVGKRSSFWAISEEEANMFERILVCLDGSKLAEQIMPYATEEAIRFQSKLVLLQVVQEPVVFSPGIPGEASVPIQTDIMVEGTKEALKRARDYLAKLAAPLRKRGIQVETVAIPGRAGEAILDYANTNSINLITIATHGRGGLRRAVFGSVADHVLRESGLPVLVIRPQDEEA
jgi:nucleotide-binding universal stress UspA family protein